MAKTFLFIAIIVACCVQLNAQTTVSGKITDESKNPLSNTNVVSKSSRALAISDNEGNYSINVSSTDTLIFVYTGFITQEIPVSGRTSIDVEMSSGTTNLDDVFVVAYGTATRSSYTGAATVINHKEIKDVPVTSFEQSLIGRMPGVQITTTSGQAGSSSAIRIRGVGSMNASNEPLYVIDGVPVVSGSVGQASGQLYTSNNIMNTLNPNDIESITVLKDAAASSLYGSRAANGVVIITTKQGKMGSPRINFRSSIGFTPDFATDNYETASVQEQINYFYRIFHDYRTSNGYTDEQANTYALNRMKSRFGIHGYDFATKGTGLYEDVIISGKTDGLENRDGKYFDWNKALFRTGIYQDYDLSVSGGREQTRYFSSLSYTKDKGRAYTNEFDRVGGRINLSQKIGKYIDFGSNVNISYNDKSGYNDTRNGGTNYLYLSRNLLFPFYWPTDYKTGKPYIARYNSLGYNPIYYDTQWENWSKTIRLTAIESLTFQILPSLVAKTIFSYDNAEVKDHIYYSPLHYHTTYGATANGSVFEYSTNIKKMVSSSTLNYSKLFNKHSVDLLAGFEAEKNQTDYSMASGSNMPSSALHTVATAGKKDADAYYWGYNMMSVLSRAEYNYDQKYFLAASFRRDGNSRIGPANRWANFWSISGAWNVKNEDFMSNFNEISIMKLRASYGTNGTFPSANYGWRSLATFGYNYNGEPGGALTTVGDKNLKWESSYSLNLGLDFGLFNNRLYGTLEYFNRDSKDLLQDVNIASATGFSTTLRNVGSINNKGIEVMIGGDIISNSAFRWSANFNASFIKSKVTELYGGQDVLWWDPTGGDNRVQFIYREGEKVLSFYTREWAGVDHSNGLPIWYTNDGTNGAFLYNGRGATNDVTEAQQVITGSPLPKAYGGFNTDFEYKGFILGFNFMYKLGGKLFDAGSKDVNEDGYYWERVRSYYAYQESWTPDNTNALYPKISGNDHTDGITNSSRHIYDATFLRLKNVNLAYNIPSSILSKIKMNAARVFFNGTNLLTFSKFKWADPEVNTFGTRGWEMPFGKTYTFGLEINL